MEKKPTPWNLGLKYGLISGLIGIIITLISYFAFEDFQKGQQLGWISFVITLILMVVAINKFKASHHGYATFGEAFRTAFFTVLVGGILSSLFILVFYYSFPDILEEMVYQQELQMEEQGMSDDQIEQAMSITGMIMKPLPMFFMTLFFSVLFGAIISLILGAIMKKNPPVTGGGAAGTETVLDAQND